MGPQLERLARKNKNFRVLKIDIDTWRSPVANQCGINSLPALWLYEGKELRKKCSGRDIGEVFQFLDR